jgi:hypothetical protein
VTTPWLWRRARARGRWWCISRCVIRWRNRRTYRRIQRPSMRTGSPFHQEGFP